MPNEEMNPALMGAAVPEPNEMDEQSATPTLDDTVEEEIKKPKKEKKDEKEAEKVLEEMMYAPTSSDADPTLEISNTTDEEKETLKPEASELLEILEKGEGALSEKYQKALLDKALKDPTSIEVETPRGWMTVKDAIGEGFDLTTGDFTNEPIPKVDWQGELSKLDPREQETIRKLTTPGTRQAGPSKIPEGGDVIPGETGETLPPQAEGAPANNIGAMDEATMGGTEVPLGGV
jgi:hypothetical protein